MTDLYIGSKVAFTLTVAFPAGVTDAVIVEILPSTNVTIMAIGAVSMTRGANLDIDPNTKFVYHPSDDSKDVSLPTFHGVILSSIFFFFFNVYIYLSSLVFTECI